MKGTEGYKIRTIVCISCGKTVTGHMPPNRHYCSLECYRNSPRPQRKTGQMKPCAQCGKEFYVEKNLLNVIRCCSPECTAQWMARRKTTHTCKICSKVFRWSPSRTKSGNYNVTYCSLACRDADPTRREMLIAMNAKQQQMQPNKIERLGYAILDRLGFTYEPQYLIGGKFCVDAFIPSCSLVVQFDGDYWHCNPAFFPEPDSRQQKRMRLDRSQDAYMATCGYTVLRFWASDIEKHPENVITRLQPFVVLPVHTLAAQE